MKSKSLLLILATALFILLGGCSFFGDVPTGYYLLVAKDDVSYTGVVAYSEIWQFANDEKTVYTNEYDTDQYETENSKEYKFSAFTKTVEAFGTVSYDFQGDNLVINETTIDRKTYTLIPLEESFPPESWTTVPVDNHTEETTAEITINGDTKENVVYLLIPGSYTPSDGDYYQFQGTAGQSYGIDLRAADFIAARLYNEDMEEVGDAWYSNSWTDDDFQHDWTPTATGTYILRIYASSMDNMPYQVKIVTN